MRLAAPSPSLLPEPLREKAYLLQQHGLRIPSAAIQAGIRRLARLGEAPTAEQIAAVRKRHRDLLAEDLENVRGGLYPAELLFQIPVTEYARAVPKLAREIPRTLRRMRTGDYRDLPPSVNLADYPPYFRRTFHWQTDGYLSARSAALYDLSVEFLFGGTADVMRRQIVPPITRLVRGRETHEHGGAGDLRVLDVATGTGRGLAQLARAHPKLRYTALDLSPFYLKHAGELLRGVEHLSLVEDNAEKMPFRDGAFDAVTCVYLFHELPKNARRHVYREMKRVLRPGGLLVIQDSAQASESPDLAFQLGAFSADFHEPFHADFVKDPIEDALLEEGFRVESVAPHFLSKTVVARSLPARMLTRA
jgi:ubiquinone/menaquinone biosynthesis C-methylase UbiE